MSDDDAAGQRPSWAPTPPTPPTPVAPPPWLAKGGDEEADAVADTPADADDSDAAPDASLAESDAPVAPAAYSSDAGYRSTFVSSAADAAAPGARAAGPRLAPSDVVSAQRIGAGGRYPSTPATSPWSRSPGQRSIPRRTIGVIVAAVVILVVWAIPALHGISTSGSGGGTDSTYTSQAGGSYDRTRLRMMLDQVMALNRSLPDRVGAPRPKDAARATALYHEITDWRAAHDRLAPSDERLARTGAAFAEALGVWLSHPKADAPYKAYLAAWHRWDVADPTWQSK